MTKITFSAQNVMPDQLANRTGNLSRKLYDMDNSLAQDGKPTQPVGIGSEIAQTHPYSGGIPEQPTPSAFGFGTENTVDNGQLNAYLNQVRLSAYYQQNPQSVLGVSATYGTTMGGPIPYDSPKSSQSAPTTYNSYNNGYQRVEHFQDSPEDLLEEPEESETEKLLYLVGTGVALTALAGLTVALTYQNSN